MAAAVADYTPAERATRKVQKSGDTLTLVLKRTPDILGDLGRRRLKTGHGPVLVGFAAETDDLVARGIPRGSIRVIYNGVDSARLTPDPSERSVAPLFVYLGRLKKYKRVDVVIRAFADLNVPDATLQIAGTGDYRAQLEGLVKSLDLSSRVKFLGFIPEEEKVHLLRRAWASTLASPKEG